MNNSDRDPTSLKMVKLWNKLASIAAWECVRAVDSARQFALKNTEHSSANVAAKLAFAMKRSSVAIRARAREDIARRNAAAARGQR